MLDLGVYGAIGCNAVGYVRGSGCLREWLSRSSFAGEIPRSDEMYRSMRLLLWVDLVVDRAQLVNIRVLEICW